MVMPERSFSNEKYRYGFNGKENDNEVKGIGNSVDFGARIYDGRLGRFLSIDPLAQKFPSESNYSYAGNSPIFFIDNEGKKKTTYLVTLLENGKINIQVQVNHRAIALKSYRTHEGDVKFWSADIKQTIVKDHNGKVIHKSAETFTQSKDNYYVRRLKNAFSGEQTQAFGFDIKNTGGFESPAANDIKGKADVIEQLDLEGMAMPDGAGKKLTEAVDAFIDVANKIRKINKMPKTGVDGNVRAISDIISGSFEFGEKMTEATEFAVDKFSKSKGNEVKCIDGCGFEGSKDQGDSLKKANPGQHTVIPK
jgi:RHS repeat-associated protein